MAYTYEDFVAAANNAGVMKHFTNGDLTVARKNPEYGMSVAGLLKDISAANTEEQRLLARESINQMRKNYGVSDAGTGTVPGYTPAYGTTIDDLMHQINGYGSFNYDSQNSYQALLDSIVNQQPFSYDLQSDPSWGAYKKAYMREGDRASANALAQAAAASGGRASSYAMTAAQQAGNYYAGQLSDVIPTLEQNAYDRYLGDFNRKLSSLGALESDRDFDYQKWMNEYNMLQNSLGNYQGQDETDYQRYLNALELQRQAEQDQATQKQLEYENALALYQLLGYATPEVAAILGIEAGSGGKDTGSNPYAGGDEPGSLTGDDNQLVPVVDTGDEEPVADEMTIDENSIFDLGYGMINEEELDRLVASGEVREVIDGSVIRFERVNPPKGDEKPWITPLDLPRTRKRGSDGGASVKGGLKSKLDRVSV